MSFPVLLKAAGKDIAGNSNRDSKIHLTRYVQEGEMIKSEVCVLAHPKFAGFDPKLHICGRGPVRKSIVYLALNDA